MGEAWERGIYHTSNSHECMGVIEKPCSCTQFIQSRIFLQITQESVLVLQVTRESGSGTTSHVHTSERAMKPKVHTITIVPSYTNKKYHKFVAVGIDTRAVHSLQYREQQTRIISLYYGHMVDFYLGTKR